MDEATARRGVQVAAYVALVAAVVGTVVAINGRMTYHDGRAWLGSGLFFAAGLVAVFCIRHGHRHDHERGRSVALVAVLVALLGVIVVGSDVVAEIRFYSRNPARACCAP